MTQLELASLLIFLLATLSLYALIVSRKNLALLFVLIPAALCASLYTGYTIYALQGTPIASELPVDKNVEIAFAEPAKPWIYLLMRVDGAEEAVYYKIPYTENNLEQIKKAMEAKERGQQGQPQGRFKRGNTGESKSQEYIFMQNPEIPLPPKPRDDLSTGTPINSPYFRQ